ncbi:MAG: hypothetical protein U1F10_13535 [Burkholderiales bacterium]
MHEIDMQQMSEAFFPCWKAAAEHLNKQAQGGIQSWLRAHPYPPFLEHLSFRLGNQLFFVRVEDSDGHVQGPGGVHGLISVAKAANGVACLLRMRHKLGGAWAPEIRGWGLVDAKTGLAFDPVALVTEAKVEMTPWELHDFAVQVVRKHLESQGLRLMSWQANPEVDPSIWFFGKGNQPEWVVVRCVKYPSSEAPRPSNWSVIANRCERLSPVGHFASVSLVSVDQPFTSQHEAPVVDLHRILTRVLH